MSQFSRIQNDSGIVQFLNSLNLTEDFCVIDLLPDVMEPDSSVVYCIFSNSTKVSMDTTFASNEMLLISILEILDRMLCEDAGIALMDDFRFSIIDSGIMYFRLSR